MSWKSSHGWEDWLCTGSRHINLLNYIYYPVAVVVPQLILFWWLRTGYPMNAWFGEHFHENVCLELARLNAMQATPPCGRTCTLWEYLLLSCRRTLVLSESSHIMGELPKCLPSLLINGKIPVHVVEVFTVKGWLTMYGKSSHQSLKLYLLFCGCCCFTAYSVLIGQ